MAHSGVTPWVWTRDRREPKSCQRTSEAKSSLLASAELDKRGPVPDNAGAA